MEQEEKTVSEEKREAAYFETMEVTGGSLYVQLLDKRSLAVFPAGQQGARLVTIEEEYRYKHCAADESRLYLADNDGKAFVVYGVENGKHTVYPLDCQEKIDNNILAVEKYGTCVFVISQYKGLMYLFDTEQETLMREDGLSHLLAERFGKQAEYMLWCWRAGRILYIRASADGECDMFLYDMAERKAERAPENLFPAKMAAACMFEAAVYILEDQSHISIRKLNSQAREPERICLTELDQMLHRQGIEQVFSALAATKKNIWLFPSVFCDDIYIYDKETGNVEKHDGYPPDFAYDSGKKWAKISEIKEREGHIYVAARLSNYYLVIDTESGTGVWEPAFVTDLIPYYMETAQEKKDSAMYECRDLSLESYLEYLPRYQPTVKEWENVGGRIWEKLK